MAWASAQLYLQPGLAQPEPARQPLDERPLPGAAKASAGGGASPLVAELTEENVKVT